jgi:hypothetical protein
MPLEAPKMASRPLEERAARADCRSLEDTDHSRACYPNDPALHPTAHAHCNLRVFVSAVCYNDDTQLLSGSGAHWQEQKGAFTTVYYLGMCS